MSFGNYQDKKSLDGEQIPIKKEYFSLIKSGKKTVEGRVNRGLFKKAQVGDKVTFFCRSDSVKCCINEVKIYQSFREMLMEEGVGNCLFQACTLEEGVKIYESLPGYAEKANKFGVIALKIAKMDHPSLPYGIPIVHHSASSLRNAVGYRSPHEDFYRRDEKDYRRRESDYRRLDRDSHGYRRDDPDRDEKTRRLDRETDRERYERKSRYSSEEYTYRKNREFKDEKHSGESLKRKYDAIEKGSEAKLEKDEASPSASKKARVSEPEEKK